MQKSIIPLLLKLTYYFGIVFLMSSSPIKSETLLEIQTKLDTKKVNADKIFWHNYSVFSSEEQELDKLLLISKYIKPDLSFIPWNLKKYGRLINWRVYAHALNKKATTEKELVATLHLSAYSNSVALIKNILAKGIDVNVRGYNNQTALMFAVYNNMLPAIQTLLMYGADPNLQDDNGQTALHYSGRVTTNDDRNLVILTLLNYGADASIKDISNETPFQQESVLDNRILKQLKRTVNKDQWQNRIQRQMNSTNGSMHNHTIRLQRYYKMGAKSNTPSGGPLYYSFNSRSGYFPKGYLHLQMGADINHQENQLLLKEALVSGNLRHVALFLEFGANPNQLFEDGMRPLHLVLEKNIMLSKILLKYGADPNLKNKYGISANKMCVNNKKCKSLNPSGLLPYNKKN